MTRVLSVPKLLLITLVIAFVVPCHVAARAEDGRAPRYLVEAIEIRGNEKTRDQVIRDALTVEPGQWLSIDDPAFELSRFRVLSLGFFSEVHLRLRRGTKRGHVVLVVDVVERGTIVLTDVFLGTSEATSAWGGLGVAERNLLGRGIGVEGAFVMGTDPDVERAALQQAYSLRIDVPRLGGGPLEISASFNYLNGSEFFRRSGPSDSSDPANFLSSRYRRVGGSIGIGFETGQYTRLYLDYRLEGVDADIPAGAVRTLPSGAAVPIDFGILDGDSMLSVVNVTIERDTRSHPIVPDRGSLLSVSAAASTRAIGSSYSWIRLSGGYRHYFPLPWHHTLAADVFAGVLFGEAPFFEKFFIGDLNDLVPSRALGLNFSTLPSRNIFGTSINEKRYEEIAFRSSVEYIIPWFRSRRFFYAGDFFVDVGLIFLASRDDLRMRDHGLGVSIPVDLTIDAGLRLDTRIGVFRLSIGNALGRIPF